MHHCTTDTVWDLSNVIALYVCPGEKVREITRELRGRAVLRVILRAHAISREFLAKSRKMAIQRERA